jgi:glycosyltransferase involved in cell wall biosynthesis
MSKTAGILMPCRGHLPHVQLAVQSILSQTHRDFDFLIINDGSEPVVREYLENIQDSRVRVIHHETSIGVSRSLNKGLRELQTEIVIRMDSDDIAHPGRLALQCQYLTAHPEITVLGGQVQNMDGQGKSPRVPLTHPDIGYRLNWSNALNHPTVAYRRQAILDFGGYDESLGPLEEDLELWTRLFFQTRLANLTEVILDYRVHPNQTSKVHWAATETVRSRILARHLGRSSRDAPWHRFLTIRTGGRLNTAPRRRNGRAGQATSIDSERLCAAFQVLPVIRAGI